MKGSPSPNKLLQWFDPRGRTAGSWGFMLNRITGLGLLLYFTLHMVALRQLTQGADAYDGFIKLMKNPVFTLGELLVIAAGIMHGINGIRIGLTSFGIGVRYQLAMLIVAGFLSFSGIAFFAVRMLGGG
jgi:succinate dehydrogenase / fumarate reductase, cytochrome b subunit